jgi:hypothetical protein|tara:strand:- start:539 stop:769 length:231 start_codon:yes stop_codon:yes gene_type:complete
MEMLMKILLSILGFFSALAIPFIGWVGISIVDLKVDVAETHGKVAANYEMIRPMWEEFLSEKSVANLALSDIKTNK